MRTSELPPLGVVPDRLEPSDWFESSEQKLSEQRYCDGWNACREAMLASVPPAPQAEHSQGVRGGCEHDWSVESAANNWRSHCRLCGRQAAGSGQ